MKALLYKLIGKLFFLIFHTHKGLMKKLHPKKMKLSMKEKKKLQRQNQTAEERQIAKSKNNEEHIFSRQHEKLKTAGKTS